MQGKTCKPSMGFSFAAGTTDGPGAFDFTQGERLGLIVILGWRGGGGPAPRIFQVAIFRQKVIFGQNHFIFGKRLHFWVTLFVLAFLTFDMCSTGKPRYNELGYKVPVPVLARQSSRSRFFSCVVQWKAQSFTTSSDIARFWL